MGACAGKKAKKSSITPTVSTEGGGVETEANAQQRESEELVALRKIYLASEGRMNRRIKNCFECAFGKESDHVTDLNLKFVNLGPEGMLQLSSVLPFYQNLSSLRLWKTRFGSEGAVHLGKGLQHLPNLKLLSLEDNDIGAEGLSRFAEGLKSLLNLEELYIHSNRLGPDGGIVLSTIVGSYRRLRSLTADENGLEDQAAEVIIRSLLRSAHTLRLIGMSFNRLTDHTANFLLRYVRDFIELKRVALNGNHVSEDLRDSLMTDGPQAYSAYMPKPKKSLKRKSRNKAGKGDMSLNLPPRRAPQRLPPKEIPDTLAARSGKSAEPNRLPKLPRLQSRTPDPSLSGKQMNDRNTSSSVDISLEKLEKLQFKSITARSEWLSLQERKFALQLLNRNFLDVSVDEMDEMMFDNKYEVLLHRHECSKGEPRLPPIRRQSPG